MEDNHPDMPDLSGLSDFERELFEFILEKWPTSALEVAESFNEDISDREKKKRMSTKYAYYLKKLVEKRLIMSKKAGNSLIVWPVIVEKYRVVHEILKGEKFDYAADFIKLASKKVARDA
jgi:predicted transcriptional regulator